MTTIDVFEETRKEPPARTGFFVQLRQGWRAYVHRFEERRIIVKLSRKDGRLLRDMGFEPEDIYAALDGTWDQVPRRLLPRI
jgi:uncharacterized protein YjiS (DUF1127 family)